ncbi:hypothetical protein [Novosphingobium sp. THN1]|uniref:hypothetical protein n=1 Tax=Novosphingobium sp. THN1 TaxID=1016987 RepID=UPI001F076A03|nr:hypothetical protein [Novosphingobium sp. THN1]
MLTKGDDFPLHQTPEPIAYAGTDRNFYDRYFFNGYAPDGSGFFALALGIYPHLNVADAHFSCIRGGVQYNLHASRELNMERFDLAVGPVSIEIVEPLKVLRVRVRGEGLAAELTFTGRAFPIEEPRFVHRIGPRTFMDYTRLTQNGHYTGWIEVDGERIDLAAGTCGTRDRSWGCAPLARLTRSLMGMALSRPSSGNGRLLICPTAACSSISTLIAMARRGTRGPLSRLTAVTRNRSSKPPLPLWFRPCSPPRGGPPAGL